jgi:hypothetical protein
MRYLAVALTVLGLWPPGPGRPADEPDLKTVLRRAADYTEDYYARLSSMVAEERYVQTTSPDRSAMSSGPVPPASGRERVLRSDFAIVQLAGDGTWIGVRDVLEVDGEVVPGERGRLQALLSDTRTPLAARVRRLADEQATYNVGDLYRTINVPTLPLEFLLRERQPRFRFKRTRTAMTDGAPVWTVTFEERDRPTLIRTPEGRDVVSGGLFQIDPRTGAVLRTELRPGENMARRLRSLILVSYARHARFDMLLPEVMDELYVSSTNRIEGHATYSNYRRFETTTRIR